MKRWFPWLLALFFPGLAPAQPAPGPRPAITGISHVTLYADDLQKSRQFYSLLGWEAVPATGIPSGLRFYANHLQYVELVSAPAPDTMDRLELVAFATSNADALRKYLASAGVTVPANVARDKDGSRSFLVHDPEGNSVVFAQSGPRPLPRPADADQRLSTHIIHAGYLVRNRAAMDHFYKDLLGFRLYWQGGAKPDQTDWVMMQVPDGTDYIEYMLNLPPHPSRAQLGSANHFAPGVVSIAEFEKQLEQRGWQAPAGTRPVLGLDAKWQLGLHDPDGTRVECMEYKPVKTPCCSAYTGPQPEFSAAW